MNYFAFGSNLSSRRLLQRLPQAKISDVALLHQYRLCFRSNLQGESGKCDMVFTGKPDDKVYGIIYLLTESEKKLLDVYETGGFGYRDKVVEVARLNGETTQAVTYYDGNNLGLQAPYHWYREHVLRGALEHCFPAEYVAGIEAIESVEDPNCVRATIEMSIYPENDE